MGDRIDLRRQLQGLAFRQAGYFSARQAFTLGYTYQAQKYHADRGNWLRIDRALFRLPDWPAEETDIYVRWSVWAEGSGTISHQSAASILGLGDFDAGDVHLTLPRPTKSKVSGVVLHHATLLPTEIAQRPGFSLTTPLRTVLDLAASGVAQERLTAAVLDGFDSAMLTKRRVRLAASSFSDSTALRIERALTDLDQIGSDESASR